jgi:hypothetical protein
MQCLFVRLLLAGASLRGAPRLLEIFVQAAGWSWSVPHWTTGRLWLLRLGHGVLTMPKTKADDWVWLIDHSVQVGQEKCLVILGIRLRDLPPAGQCLTHTDLCLLALVPRKSWTRQEVDEQLEALALKTGIPRVIVDDHGVDISGGVQFFQDRHPQTVEIYDAKHKAACLLKGRLEKNPRWHDFQKLLTQTRCAIQQTELGFLTPPAPKPKARFMNLTATLRWAANVLAVLAQPPAVVQERIRPERLREKLGWLHGFSSDLNEWSEWQEVANAVVAFVNRQGISRNAAPALRRALPKTTHDSSHVLAEELVNFVAVQAQQAKPGERFPGSTEVLESCFGRFKQLEKQQARGGFTSLLLGFGALVTETTTRVVQKALDHSATKDISAWCNEHLGMTVFSQRKLAFAECATKAA